VEEQAGERSAGMNDAAALPSLVTGGRLWAREVFRESGELRALYELSPVPTYVWQRQGDDFVLLDHNSAALVITQGKASDFLGMMAGEMYRDRPQILEQLSRCFATQGVFDEGMPYRFFSTGETKHLVVRYAFVPPDFVMVYTVDLTEWRLAQEQVRRSHEQTLRRHGLLLALSQAAQAVQRARTPEAIYETIGNEIANLDYHAIVFALAEDHTYMTITYLTWQPAMLDAAERLFGLSASNLRIPLAPDGFFQPVIAEGQSAFCESTARLVAMGFPGIGQSLAERLTGMLDTGQSIYAPLVVGGKVIGVLAIAGTGLTDADLPAVTAFANQAGSALENARLLKQQRDSQERLRQLAQQTVSAQEQERQRLSHALHDEAGQALTALRINLELIYEDLPPESGALRQRLRDAAALTSTTMERIRLLAQDLRPPALDAVGLNPTLAGFCLEFSQRTRLAIEYHGLDLPELPEAASICLYRCLQEALTNAAKHAAADQVRVVLSRDPEMLCLSVEDDGRGFDGAAWPSGSAWPKGIGLLGIQERLELLGGRLEIDSRPGEGTRLVASLPIQEAVSRSEGES
jgi:signal transduction histidine kinase